MRAQSVLKQVYDNIGDTYTSEHETVRYFSALEQFQLQAALMVQSVRIHKRPEKLKVLNIGTGDGSQYHLSTHIAYINKNNYYELDISKVMLSNSESQNKICGNALNMPFKDKSFDIVIAGLCDHLEPKHFFNESFRILNDQGALAVTYPHKELMDTIRKDIYNIDPVFTSYDGRTLLRSHSMMPDNVSQLYKVSGFSSQEINNLNQDNWMLYYENSRVSETIKQAAKLLHKDPKNMPILVFGFGVKGNEYLGNVRYALWGNKCSLFEDFMKWPGNFNKIEYKRSSFEI